MTLYSICQEKLESLSKFLSEQSNPSLNERAKVLQEQFSLLQSKEPNYEIVVALLDALHNFQRLNFLHQAGVHPNGLQELDELSETNEKSWAQITPLQVEPALCEKLAGRLIHGAFQHIPGGSYPDEPSDEPPLSKDKTIIIASPDGRGTTEHVITYMLKHDIPFEVDFTDWLFKKRLKQLTENVETLAEYNAGKYNTCSKAIYVDSNAPQNASENESDTKYQKYKQALSSYETKRRSGEVFYTLTKIPTQEDAITDGIEYNEYLKLFFELCDQPWGKIQEANNQLIETLESARTMRFVDEDTGTDLTMSIEGDRWANSLVLKNIPGSEVFASPIIDSVNGKLVAKGKFKYKQGDIIEDITLIFENGRVVAFDAAKGKDALAKIIEADDGKGEGSRFVGEIGIGTNPWLRKHIMNPLLVEKISGSFHIALGDSYSFKRYDNKDVKLDNGNRSASGVHWDITTMMQGEKARIILDNDKIIMDKGQFTDPQLEVLNKGWEAIKNRPAYWDTRLAELALERSGRVIT